MIPHALHPFFPTWFCSFNFARDLVTLGTKAWTWQVSKIPVFPMLSESLEKKPTVFFQRPEMTPRWDLWRKNSYWKSHIWCFFFWGLMNERLSCGKNAVYCFWKQPFLCSRGFFFKHETPESGETEHLYCIFRIFKGTFQGKFHLQAKRRAKMANLTSLNLENPWLIVPLNPFNPYMLRDISFDQIKSQGRSLNLMTRIRMDSHDISACQESLRTDSLERRQIKAEFPQSHGGGWRWGFPFQIAPAPLVTVSFFSVPVFFNFSRGTSEYRKP